MPNSAARQPSMPADVQALASRTQSDPLGKLDDTIDTFRIDSETKALLSVQAARAGKPLVEFIRFVLQVQAHGADRVRSLHMRKFDLVGNLLPLSVMRDSDGGHV